MKDIKRLVLVILVVILLIYSLVLSSTNIFSKNLLLNFIVLIILLLLGLYIIGLIINRGKGNNIKFKDKLFNSLVENSNTIYIMINSVNNKVLYVSSNIEDILGIKNDRTSEEKVFDILNLPIIKSELNNWDKLSEYVSQMIEYDHPKYNHQMWIKLRIFPYKQKKEEYYVIQITDATKEHDRQHLLVTQATDIKARESQLNQITSSSYDVEMNINIVKNICDFKYFKKDNLYFGEEKRGTYTEILKDILNKYINPSDREMVYENLSIENLKSHFSKYELNSFVIRYRLGSEKKDNIWLESTIFFLSNRQNNRVSILTKNVTENAESIREQNVLLQNALNEAKMANKAKTDLISTISHEIRTPLTNIMGLSETLLNKDLDNSIREDIENINESSNDMLNIIYGLLDTAKIEKRIIEKEEQQYSIFKLFNKLEETTKDLIGNKNIKVNLNLDNNLPIILFGDSKRINQALIQIINNSVKYTNEGEINITVRGEKQDNSVNLLVEISDTGNGIDSDKLNSIMNSKDSNNGISSVKKIIELLDGKFEIESKLGEYTKVTISIVQKIVEDNKIRTMMENNKKAEKFDLRGKKVLVVDDNKLNLKVTKRLLESYNLSITLVESGLECIDLIKEQNTFDLILMDQMMPGIDGTSTLQRLKEIKDFNTPIVVLTADAMEGQKEKYIAKGFDDYISKPIDKSELSRVLKKFIKES